ncbi:MAG: PHB depolymerase family esterase [Candidatus Sulfotelmatobacter sp.]
MKLKVSSMNLPRLRRSHFPHLLGLCLLGSLCLLPLHAQDSPKPESPKSDSQEKASAAQDSQEKVDVNDVSRTYVVHLPQGYNQQQHYPVVILLHGRNQDAADMAGITHFNRLADKDSIIAVYPNAAHGSWNIGVRPEQVNQAMQPRRGGRRGGWGGYPGGGGGYPGGGGGYPGGGGGGYPGGGQGGGQNGGENPDENRNKSEPPDDVAFLNQMLDQLPMKYSVDTRRIYATGLGDGGFMALRVGCNMADRVAAIAAVGAAMPKTMICLPARAASVLFINGTDDPIVPDNGGTYKPGRFHVLSAEDSAKTWAKFDHCGEKPEQAKLPSADKGGKETKTYTYSGCQDNAQVVLYSVKNGGNTWPGGEQYMSEKEVGKTSNALNANDAIWNFLVTKKITGESGTEK